jgi:hypothetical protein
MARSGRPDLVRGEGWGEGVTDSVVLLVVLSGFDEPVIEILMVRDPSSLLLPNGEKE